LLRVDRSPRGVLRGRLRGNRASLGCDRDPLRRNRILDGVVRVRVGVDRTSTGPNRGRTRRNRSRIRCNSTGAEWRRQTTVLGVSRAGESGERSKRSTSNTGRSRAVARRTGATSRPTRRASVMAMFSLRGTGERSSDDGNSEMKCRPSSRSRALGRAPPMDEPWRSAPPAWCSTSRSPAHRNCPSPTRADRCAGRGLRGRRRASSGPP
jgi:hypothetical protein